MKAGGSGAGVGSGEGEAVERGHDERIGRFGVLCGVGNGAEEETDAGAVDAGGVGGGGLGEDGAGLAGSGDVGDGAEVEREAADVDGGGAFALAEDARDGDLLGSEAFGDTDGPLAANGDAGRGGLGEDAAGRGVGRVEAIFESEAEAERAGLMAGFGEGEAGEGGDLDLVAMNGEAHGDKGGHKRHQHHGQCAEEDVEEAIEGGEVDFHGAGSGYRRAGHVFERFQGECTERKGNAEGLRKQRGL